jgi:uncharacterized membrane protein
MASFAMWILLVHILSAFWLAAGAFAGAVVRAQAKRASELAGRVTALRIGNRLVSVFAIPGSLAAGLTGLSLLDPFGYGFRPHWVHAALAIWLLLTAVGVFYTAPHLRRLLAAAEASLKAGAPSVELQRLAQKKLPGILADVSALGIVVLVFLMVLRPF